ncbi:ExbD/TolR family protein [Qipengyuania marisflavi]|uniref:Biopolymer transporter ExbD n=1 Tax=Qipengyuania marisflavi TaxID=2486356 RepID=A0A5S3PWW7_9SPHN|nr:biopolymer transporter ExbD [Qipengyuania marisflavi]TMM48105.1 biopolymer transporter ExbD [Qipengyuania marisflavi]
MAMSGGKDDGAPMMEMNMTPLIDVLLVLLIMFIITIPVATHSVDIDLPAPSPAPPNMVEPDKNKLVLTGTDEILWNGNPINQGQLRTLLDESRSINPEPELQFEPEPLASYEIAANVLQVIKASGVTKFGFVGNERYRTFN